MDKQREDMWVKTGAQLQAARKMLAALKLVHANWATGRASIMPSTGCAIGAAIDQAEKIGLKEDSDGPANT